MRKARKFKTFGITHDSLGGMTLHIHGVPSWAKRELKEFRITATEILPSPRKRRAKKGVK